MSKKSFILYTDLHETIKELDDTEAANLLRAIFRYHSGEDIGDVDRSTKLIMKGLEQTFKREDSKWESIRKKRAEAGRKGGKATQDQAKQAKQANASFVKQNQANQAVTVTGNVTEKNSSSAASADAKVKEEFWLSAKKRKLTGKRLEAFKLFWKSFAFAKGRASAIDSWLDIPELNNELVDRICQSAELYAIERATIRANGNTPIYAQGWITAMRWEDEPIIATMIQSGFGADGMKKCTIDLTEIYRDKNEGYDENGLKIKENVG